MIAAIVPVPRERRFTPRHGDQPIAPQAWYDWIFTDATSMQSRAWGSRELNPLPAELTHPQQRGCCGGSAQGLAHRGLLPQRGGAGAAKRRTPPLHSWTGTCPLALPSPGSWGGQLGHDAVRAVCAPAGLRIPLVGWLPVRQASHSAPPTSRRLGSVPCTDVSWANSPGGSPMAVIELGLDCGARWQFGGKQLPPPNSLPPDASVMATSALPVDCIRVRAVVAGEP